MSGRNLMCALFKSNECYQKGHVVMYGVVG